MGYAKRQLMKQLEEGWRSLGDKHCCPKCVDDYAIQDFIRDNAVSIECDYCGAVFAEESCAHMDEVLSFISEGIHREYEDPANQVGYDSSEGGYLLPTTDSWDLIAELEIVSQNQRLYEEIAEAFNDRIWVQKDPYGLRPCEELIYTWESFARQVKHEVRFLFLNMKARSKYDPEPEPFTILESIGHIVRDLGLTTVLSEGSSLYRGRQHDDATTITQWDEISSPPPDFASQSRFSPSGISMFYGSNNASTCFLETFDRNTSKARFSVGEFIVEQDLILLNLTNLPSIPSLFDESRAFERMPLIFMRQFEMDCSLPIKRDGREHIDYVPTQVVSEYFRHLFRLTPEEEHGIDGILYNSSKAESQTCVTLFSGPEIADPNSSSRYLSLRNTVEYLIDFERMALSEPGDGANSDSAPVVPPSAPSE